MNLKIEDFCIRCGICITLYPELFEMDLDEDVVHIKIKEIPASLMGKAKDSVKNCAVNAIRLNKG